MQDTDDRDTIIGLDGREIDITPQLVQLRTICRRSYPDVPLALEDSKFLHRFGWGLIAVAGPEMPSDLIDDMLDEQEISPAFADLLRAKWSDLVARCA